MRLLWVHAANEPQFADYAKEHHERAVDAALGLIGGTIADRTMRRWAARTVVHYLFDAVLAWLEVGTPSRDEEFVDTATNGLQAMYLAWTETPAS
jgi:hypothetical protein